MPNRTYHILTQFLWPDGAPTGIYAEQLADALLREGEQVVLVTGQGTYRKASRPEPKTPILRLSHKTGNGLNLFTKGIEFWSLGRAFANYVSEKVNAGDAVIVTTAPPTSLWLADRIKERGATGIYWLQDYYPELIKGLVAYPDFVGTILRGFWKSKLDRWHYVIRAANNIGFESHNTVTFRNWPTLDLGTEKLFEPKTALFAGNLGRGHSIPDLAAKCEELRKDGYRVFVRAHGVKAKLLPDWLERLPDHVTEDELIAELWRAEVHLIAAHPKIERAIFPSKFWNIIGTGRKIIPTGFSGAMAEEFNDSLTADYKNHLHAWVGFLKKI